MKIISICIPTYEMNGLGEKYLQYSFDVLEKQTFKDFDVVVSDHSKNDSIKKLCEKYKNKIDISYFRNEEKRGNSSANLNNAIKKATGKIIKVLFQDDFLYSKNSLKDISENFDLKKDRWLVTACEHTKDDGKTYYRPFYPKYDDSTIFLKNTISSPSVLTIKNDNPLLFDEKLIWYMDTEYYKRCYDKFGEPKILNSINVVNRIGKHQVTNTLISEKIKNDEYAYILKKYNDKYRLPKVFFRKIKTYLKYLRDFSNK